MEDAKELENYEKAGKIAFSVLQKSKEFIKPGANVFEAVEKLEQMVREQGAQPAFPINISINENAAHFTPALNDTLIIDEKDLVKVDVGAQVEGYIGDCALTLDFSREQGKLVEASDAALEEAIATIKPGKRTGEIGETVEAKVKSLGFKPIENLTGHALAQYELHAGGEIPSVGRAGGAEIMEGDVYAIEPFVTDGTGRVVDTNHVEIFSLVQARPIRMSSARDIIKLAEQNYKNLPFAERWIRKNFKSEVVLHASLRQLIAAEILKQYPVLKEESNALVSQTECTVVVEKDGARILTK